MIVNVKVIIILAIIKLKFIFKYLKPLFARNMFPGAFMIINIIFDLILSLYYNRLC